MTVSGSGDLARIRRLAEPASYWVGKTPAAPLLPTNILLFHRNSRAALRHGTASPHQHHRHVLITAVSGSGRVGVDTRVWPLREGQSLLVLPFQAHWYEQVAPGKILWLFVTFEHGRDARLEAFRHRGPLSLGGREFLNGALAAWSSAALADTLGLRLALWLNALGRRLGRTPPPPLSDSGRAWVAEVNRLAFENRERPLPLTFIARQLGVSVSLLRAEFQRTVGKSVGRYVRELKLQHAGELLHNTALSVSEVARRCGYDSVFSFSRAFHHRYRMSPSEYRRKIPNYKIQIPRKSQITNPKSQKKYRCR